MKDLKETMTVGQLLDQLKLFDRDMRVVSRTGSGGFIPLQIVWEYETGGTTVLIVEEDDQ